MSIRTDPLRSNSSVPGLTPQESGPQGPSASTINEAAQQFEDVLVRQFVQVMTDSMFSAGLTGADGPRWMEGQREQQRDAMTDVLTHQLVEADVLPFSELLVRQWKQGGVLSQPEAPKAAGFEPRPNSATHNHEKNA